MWRLALVLLVLSPAPLRAQESNARDWLRIGDELSAAGRHDEALAAFAHVLADARDPGYAAALHHTAWTYFLLDRTPEAIARFVELVDRLPPSSPLRAEAIDLLGAMFADPD